MPQPAARQGDPVTGTDTHLVWVPTPGGAPAQVPQPLPFTGTLVSNLSSSVLVNGLPAATVGSVAQNQPAHLPIPPGTSLVVPPTNQGQVQTGAPTVLVGGRQLARVGDQVLTCFDVPGPPAVISAGSPNVVVA